MDETVQLSTDLMYPTIHIFIRSKHLTDSRVDSRKKGDVQISNQTAAV